MSNPLRYFSHSIRAKLLAGVLVPLLTMALFSAVYYPMHQRTAVIEKVEENVVSLREMLAFAVGAGLSDGNFGLVQTAYEWARSNENVIYISILDETDEPLVEHDPRGVGLKDRFAARNSTATLDGDLLASAVPITYNSANYGTVLLGYSLRTVNTGQVRTRVCLRGSPATTSPISSTRRRRSSRSSTACIWCCGAAGISRTCR